MARQLENQNEEVSFLALIDVGLIDLNGHRTWAWKPLNTARITLKTSKFAFQVKPPTSYQELRRLGQWVGISLPESFREIRQRGFRAQLRFLRNLLVDFYRSGRVFYCNLRASLNYKPAPYGGKVTLFRVKQNMSYQEDPLRGTLRQSAPRGPEIYDIPGNHMSIMLDKNNVPALSSKLQACLETRLTEKGD